MRIYLDACCMRRLNDDLSQARINKEAEAVKQVLLQDRSGIIDLISSVALDNKVRPKRFYPWPD